MSAETNNKTTETVQEFLKGKPLGEFRQRGLNVNKIFSEVLTSDKSNRLIDDGTKVEGFEKLVRRKQLILEILGDMFAEIGNLCTQQPNANGAIKTMANGSRNSLPFDASAEDKIFLICLEELYRQFEAILHETVAEKMQKLDASERLKSSTLKLVKEIERLSNILQASEAKFREEIKPKQQANQNLNIKITRLKTDHDDKIRDIIHEANIKVVETKIKLDAINEVHRTLQAVKDESTKAQAEYLVEFRQIKELKSKAEQALQTFYLKFDNDIGGRGAKLEAIQKETKVAQKDFDVWEETVAKPQRIAYHELMLQKREEERQEDELKIQEFSQNRSARIIQKAWRKYLRRKLKKEGKSKVRKQRK